MGLVRRTAGAVVVTLAVAPAPAGASGPQARWRTTAGCPAPSVVVTDFWATPPGPAGHPGAAGRFRPAELDGFTSHDHVGFDGDGDGTSDPVELTPTDPTSPGTLTVHRGDGDLVLTGLPGGTSRRAASTRGDDLDGDGRDDLAVVVENRSSVAGLVVSTWIVPGSTAPGTHTFPSVAVPVPGVGPDVTGDGLDDLAGSSNTGRPGPWLSAKQRLAAGPAGGASVDVIGALVDLDHDDIADRIWLGSPDGQHGPHLQLSTGAAAALPGPRPELIDVFADDIAFNVRLIRPSGSQPVTLGGPAITVAARVETGCVAAWYGEVATDLLGRPPSGAAIERLGDDRPDRAGRAALVDGVQRAPEHAGLEVDEAYQRILGRPADAPGRRYWVAELANRRRTLSSFWAALHARAPIAPVEDWLDALYRAEVGRPIDPGAASYWAGQLPHDGRERVARRILGSAESRRHRAGVAYQRDLHRAARADERNSGASTIAEGGDEALQVRLLSSPERWAEAQRPPG